MLMIGLKVCYVVLWPGCHHFSIPFNGYMSTKQRMYHPFEIFYQIVSTMVLLSIHIYVTISTGLPYNIMQCMQSDCGQVVSRYINFISMPHNMATFC